MSPAQPVQIEIRFGALSPSLAEQLNVKPSTVELFQKDADAICRLSIRGLVAPAIIRRARQKLGIRILSALSARPRSDRAC